MVRGRLGPVVADLFPGYFALVMATGIIAIGCAQQDLDAVANLLFALAAASFVVLVVLTAARLIWFPRSLLRDLTHHRSGFSFLTIVAALNVLGSDAAILQEWWPLAWACWVVGIACWFVLLYPALVGVIVDEPKPMLGEAINGTWFLLTVSTESVAVLGAVLLAHRGASDDRLELVVLSAFTLGVVLYLIVMTMIFLRWTFVSVDHDELQPPSWIAAGGVAITVLAGSNVLAARSVSPRIDRLAPFIEGVVVMAWATATFWFPVMIAIGIWRHIVRRVALRYDPAYWALVFPIGMYAVATDRMITVTDLDGIDLVPQVALTMALVAWTAAITGMLIAWISSGRRRSRMVRTPVIAEVPERR